jgi:hypothetical protein
MRVTQSMSMFPIFESGKNDSRTFSTSAAFCVSGDNSVCGRLDDVPAGAAEFPNDMAFRIRTNVANGGELFKYLTNCHRNSAIRHYELL